MKAEKSRKQLDAENAAAKRYYHSKRGQATRLRHQKSARFKAVRVAYRKTPQYKAAHSGPEYNAKRRAYAARPHVQERLRAQRRRYYSSEKGQRAVKLERQRRLTRPQYWFRLYRSNARQRGIKFALTLDNFKAFWRQSCAYCGSKIATIGLDRVNNALGYVVGNVTSCCSICNYMKRQWSREFFTSHCAKVAAYA